MSKEINVKHHLKENEQKRTGTEENGGHMHVRDANCRNNPEYIKWLKEETEDFMKKKDNLACVCTDGEQVEEPDEPEDFMKEMDERFYKRNG